MTGHADPMRLETTDQAMRPAAMVPQKTPVTRAMVATSTPPTRDPKVGSHVATACSTLVRQKRTTEMEM
eukprot:scaffold13069_cov50-Phaeocystis_antarctica.AAC.4